MIPFFSKSIFHGQKIQNLQKMVKYILWGDRVIPALRRIGRSVFISRKNNLEVWMESEAYLELCGISTMELFLRKQLTAERIVDCFRKKPLSQIFVFKKLTFANCLIVKKLPEIFQLILQIMRRKDDLGRRSPYFKTLYDGAFSTMEHFATIINGCNYFRNLQQ